MNKLTEEQLMDAKLFEDAFHVWLEVHGVKILGSDTPFISTIDMKELKLAIIKLSQVHKEL